MMLSVSVSHFSTVSYTKKRKLKFLTKLQHSETQYAYCLEDVLLTNWILCTNICLVKLVKFVLCTIFTSIMYWLIKMIKLVKFVGR